MKARRGSQPLRSVGVTGTNGKTTTTTWTAAALEAAYGPVFRATTVGSFFGGERLPERPGFDGFLANASEVARRGAEYAAVELTSHALWGGAAKAWTSEVGVFTNLSLDHLDAHGDAEHYLASKAQLFLRLPPEGVAVLNGADAVYPLLRDVVPAHATVLTYGCLGRGAFLTELDAHIEDPQVSWVGTTWTLCGPRIGIRTCRALGIGEVFAENATAAMLGALAMGVPIDVSAAAIARTEAPPGRFEVVHENPYVVVDYAHSPDALARMCATARTLARSADGCVTLVFGAGGGRDPGKRPLMGKAARVADRILLTTDNPRDEDPRAIAAAVAAGISPHERLELEPDRHVAITRAVREARPCDVVLLAGRGHETAQFVRGKAIPLCDRDVARAALGCGQVGGEV
jgi:UDP-N-acetylmuramoyl-L-alanyl-D-glutamate--2,6-diaminopimelate ligase